MFYAPFHEFFPELAEEEIRNVQVFDDLSIPAGTYTLVESYCNQANCDCRRVFFSVYSSVSNQMEAVVAYGWESPRFYARWMNTNNPATIQALQGPLLNPGSPQSKWAPALLNLIQTVVLKDEKYIRRLETHYNLFKSVIDQREKKKLKLQKSLGFGSFSNQPQKSSRKHKQPKKS